MDTFDKLKRIRELIREAKISALSIDDKDLQIFAHKIKESIFYESDGDALILNVLHYMCPESCKVVGLSDEFLSFTAQEVLEAIGELSNGVVQINECEGYDGDESYSINFEINSEPMTVVFNSETTRSPKDIVDQLKEKLSGKHRELRENVLATYTLWEIYDENGAAIICYLPTPIAGEIQEMMNKKLGVPSACRQQ